MSIPGTPDPQAWLKDYQQRITALKEKAEKAKEQMADNRVELTSENGHVKLSVTGAGSLQSLEITDAASSAKPKELGKTIMQTYRKAVSQAGARTVEIMSGLGGPNSQAAEIVKEAIPPEPEEDEESAQDTAPEIDEQDLGIAQDDQDEEPAPPTAQSAPRPSASSPAPPPAMPSPPSSARPAEVDFEDEEDAFDGIDWES